MIIERTETQLKVKSDYHKKLPAKARQLGGKWDKSETVWVYDIRTENKVAELYIDIYGYFGEPTETVTVKYSLAEDLWEEKSGIFLCGRQIAKAWGRDTGAKVGNGIVLNNCRATSGGSWENWCTEIRRTGDHPEIIIYDAPKAIAEKFVEKHEGVEILETTINKESLLAEKERLLTRIQEIDSLLAR